MKKILLLLFIVLVHNALAQDTTQLEPAEKSSKPLKDKIYFGGNIGMVFGTYTMIGIYPLMGYKITPKFSAGIKVAYEYVQDSRYGTKYTTSNYGGSIFSRYRIIQPLYAHVEYAMMNYELYNYDGSSEREWVPFLLVGAGFSQLLAPRTWINVQVLFDVLQHDNSPYSSWEPFISVGIGVGF